MFLYFKKWKVIFFLKKKKIVMFLHWVSNDLVSETSKPLIFFLYTFPEQRSRLHNNFAFCFNFSFFVGLAKPQYIPLLTLRDTRWVLRLFSVGLLFFCFFSVIVVASRDVFSRGPMRLFAIEARNRDILFHAFFPWSTRLLFSSLVAIICFHHFILFYFFPTCHCRLRCNFFLFLHLKNISGCLL